MGWKKGRSDIHWELKVQVQMVYCLAQFVWNFKSGITTHIAEVRVILL